MSTVLPNLGAKPTDLKIENVYKITKLNNVINTFCLSFV